MFHMWTLSWNSEQEGGVNGEEEMRKENVDKKTDTSVPYSQIIDGHGQVGSGSIISLKYPSNWSVINVQPTQMCHVTLVLDLR